MDAPALAVEHEQVALDGPEAAFFRLAARADEVFELADRRLVDELAVEIMRLGGAHDAAPRPVGGDAVAHRAAEQFGDGDIRRLRLDVEQRVGDGADRVGVEPTVRRAHETLHGRVDVIERQRILADHHRT